MTGYQYWLIRYVPNAVRGEFVNIGVLVGMDGKDWALRTVDSFTRASRLGGDARQARHWLEELRLAVSHANGEGDLNRISPLLERSRSRSFTEMSMNSGIVAHMAARLNNSVQISEARPVHTLDAASAADRLYRLLVRENPTTTRTQARTRLLKRIGDEFAQIPELDRDIVQRNPRIQIGMQVKRFDLALGEDRVRQMTQVVSFTRKDLENVNQEVSAWSHVVNRLRGRGGQLEMGKSGRFLRIDQNVPIRVVHDEPQTNDQKMQLDIARESWRELGVQDFTSADIHRFALEARSLVA
ncbi:DUF3037 domain-containing protein [Arthrobacter sp. Soc17.1.1.1]|uniref:DUF3037 domain-containing protein n=1 Tax=Arthrobacter sp. Soc17.1.1.1 TaxID=3121277 RepID=UPI002FE4DFC3